MKGKKRESLRVTPLDPQLQAASSPKLRRKTPPKAPLKNTLRKGLGKRLGEKFSDVDLKGRLTRRRPLKTHSLASMIPNITTIMALCTGLSSIRFAMQERWEWAVACILIAGILDALDGRLARLLGSTSRFGAELDSFSDFISFGVCPSLVIYLWSLNTWGGFGWMVALFFSVCSALRLARFNVWSIEGRSPGWSQGFFVGVPAPTAALLGLSPLIFFLASSLSFWMHPLCSAASMIFVGVLMVSQLPTYSLKKTAIPAKWVLPLLLLVGLLAASLFAHLWLTISGIILVYVTTFPFSLRSYGRLKKEQEVSP